MDLSPTELKGETIGARGESVRTRRQRRRADAGVAEMNRTREGLQGSGDASAKLVEDLLLAKRTVREMLWPTDRPTD